MESRFYRGTGIVGLALGTFLTLPGLTLGADTGDNRVVTFTKDVAPIFQEKCQDCHRKGSLAPMSLMTYEESRPWAKSIRQRVATRQMPPWHIDKNVGVQKFKGDMSLSDEQLATVVRWVDAGAPMGDLKDMPPPKQFPSEDQWRASKSLGQPDLVIEASPYNMPAHHQDVWWRPENEIPITEPRWVRAVEIRPTTAPARKTMHHAVAYLEQDEPADSNSPDRTALLGGRGMLMEWAIGKNYDQYRDGTGKLLLPGAKIHWDLHIHASGEDTPSGVQLGIWLYPKGQEPKYRTYLTAFTGLSGHGMDIPPNAVTVTEGYTVLKQPAILENFQPHLHLRGKAMELQAILPDGTSQIVSYVGNFNFNWMTNYIYADDAAPAFPKGTIIKVTAWFDNTTANSNNPDPNQEVTYGDRTVDEMAHGWVNVTYISDEDYQKWVAEHKGKRETASNRR